MSSAPTRFRVWYRIEDVPGYRSDEESFTDLASALGYVSQWMDGGTRDRLAIYRENDTREMRFDDLVVSFSKEPYSAWRLTGAMVSR